LKEFGNINFSDGTFDNEAKDCKIPQSSYYSRDFKFYIEKSNIKCGIKERD
jgi:hypothetical protein